MFYWKWNTHSYNEVAWRNLKRDTCTEQGQVWGHFIPKNVSIVLKKTNPISSAGHKNEASVLFCFLTALKFSFSSAVFSFFLGWTFRHKYCSCSNSSFQLQVIILHRQGNETCAITSVTAGFALIWMGLQQHTATDHAQTNPFLWPSRQKKGHLFILLSGKDFFPLILGSVGLTHPNCIPSHKALS